MSETNQDKARRAYLAAYVVTRQGGRVDLKPETSTEEADAAACGVHDGIAGNPPARGEEQPNTTEHDCMAAVLAAHANGRREVLDALERWSPQKMTAPEVFAWIDSQRKGGTK